MRLILLLGITTSLIACGGDEENRDSETESISLSVSLQTSPITTLNADNYNFTGSCSYSPGTVKIEIPICGIEGSTTCLPTNSYSLNKNVSTCEDGNLSIKVTHSVNPEYLIEENFQIEKTSETNDNDDSNDPTQPIVLEVSSLQMPPNSTYGAGASLDFQVTYPEVVTVSGNPRIVLNLDSGPVYASYISGNGSRHISFRYTIVNGDNDSNGIEIFSNIELNGGSLNTEGDYLVSIDLSNHTTETSQILINTTTLAPDQVQNLNTAPTTTSTTLAASWSVPNNNGNPITHYVLQYRLKGQDVWQLLSPNPTTNSTTIPNLLPNEDYEIRVAANNGVLGAFSSIQEAQIFDLMAFNPIAWLDATDPLANATRPADGSLIETWFDKTGNAENASEPDPLRQPVYRHDVINSLPAIRFDNLDRGLQGSFSRTSGASLSIFIVGQFDSEYSDRCMFEFIGPGSARAFFIDRRYAGNTFYSPALTKGGFQLWRIENSGAQSIVTQNSSTILYNGTNDFNTDFIGSGNYFLGDDSTGDNRLHGYIGEILIFDSTLSANDITAIENYLKTKWGL